MAAKPPVRVAVIGAGNMGLNHIRKYHGLKEAQLVAIADTNPSAKEVGKEFKVRYFRDYKKMLDTVKPEAVSIVVPTPLHFEVASEVMQRGMHCMLEKPIASTVAEATKLIKLAKERAVIFTVGHVEHFNPVIRRLKQIIDNKEIGKITSITCRRVGGFPAMLPKTDVIIDLAVHDIGVLNHLLGKYPKAVASHASRTLHTKKVDAAEILLDYGNASGFIQANWITPVKIRTVAVTGSKGYVEANYLTQRLIHYENNMRRVRSKFETFIKTFGEPKQTKMKVRFQEPLALELRAFLQTIRGEAKDHLVSPKDAKEALKIALKSVERYEVE